MQYYVILDESHEMEIKSFDTKDKAIAFINQCNIMEIDIFAIFYGQQMTHRVIEDLVPNHSVNTKDEFGLY